MSMPLKSQYVLAIEGSGSGYLWLWPQDINQKYGNLTWKYSPSPFGKPPTLGPTNDSPFNLTSGVAVYYPYQVYLIQDPQQNMTLGLLNDLALDTVGVQDTGSITAGSPKWTWTMFSMGTSNAG